MELSDCPAIHPQVATTMVADQALVILADDGDVTVFNPVGSRIWSLIDGVSTIGAIAGAITAEYNTELSVAQKDVLEFLASLVELRAVVLRPTSNRPGGEAE